MTWNGDRFQLELMRCFKRWIPGRLFMRLKTNISGEMADHERWARLGRLPCQLHGNDYWMMLHMKNAVQRTAYWRGRWYEEDLLSLLNHHLGSMNVFIDIGANIGAFTLHAAWLLRKNGQVVAFEPNPYLFQALQGHVSINRIQNVTLHNIALSDTEGTLILKGCTDDTGFTTARPEFSLDDPSDYCEACMKLGDELLKNIDPNSSGIYKIDVEGFELKVLHGMKQFIQKHDRFMYIVEVTDDWLRQSEGSAEILFEFFAEYGYKPFRVNPEDNSHKALDAPLSDKYQYNVLFKKA